MRRRAWRQSSSLGLRLVQMLTRQLHGRTEVIPGAGTEFVIDFAPIQDTPDTPIAQG